MDSTAVVILNYNGLDYLKQFLPSVIENSGDCQIAVIDNQSSDQSVTYLQNSHPSVKLIQLDNNYGFSGGYNKGLQSVDADYLILLNSDVQVPKGWTVGLINYLKAHPKVGVCQPKILSFHEPERFDYAGAAGGFVDLLGYPFCRGRVFDTLEQDRGQYNKSQLIFWASGACMAIRQSLFNQIGGFDEDFFAHMEEIDLCWRCQRLGHKVAFVGESQVYHVGGGTLASSNPFKTFLNFRNGLSILLKNVPGNQLWWKLPIRMLLDDIAAIRFCLMGSWSHCWAVWRAHFKFLVNIPRTWRKRQALITLVPVKLHDRMIVWDYFVKGRKTYEKMRKIV